MHLLKTTAVLASSLSLISASYNYPSADASELYARDADAYDADLPELYARDAFDEDLSDLYARDADADLDELDFAESSLHARSPQVPGAGMMAGGSCRTGCFTKYLERRKKVMSIDMKIKAKRRMRQMETSMGSAGGGGSASKMSAGEGSSSKMSSSGEGASAGSGSSKLSRRYAAGAELAAERLAGAGSSTHRPRRPWDSKRMMKKIKASYQRCQGRCKVGGGPGGAGAGAMGGSGSMGSKGASLGASKGAE